MSKTYTVVGVSTCEQGKTKVRFANDFAVRIKVLQKAGHTNLELIELPSAMTKSQACEYLIQTGGVFKQHKALIEATRDVKEGLEAGKTVKKAVAKQAKVTKSVKAVEKSIKVSKETKDDLIVEELKALVGEATQ
jgi:hypothetical protein